MWEQEEIQEQGKERKNGNKWKKIGRKERKERGVRRMWEVERKGAEKEGRNI